MSDFDLSMITGNEPPLKTDDEKDDEIKRLRARVEALKTQDEGWEKVCAEVGKYRDIGESKPDAVLAEIVALRDLVEKNTIKGIAVARERDAEIERLRTAGVAEMMLENVNIASFVEDKEAEIERLKARVEELAPYAVVGRSVVQSKRKIRRAFLGTGHRCDATAICQGIVDMIEAHAAWPLPTEQEEEG